MDQRRKIIVSTLVIALTLGGVYAAANAWIDVQVAGLKGQVLSELIQSGEVEPALKLKCTGYLQRKIVNERLLAKICNCYALNLVHMNVASLSLLDRMVKTGAITKACMTLAPSVPD